MKTLIHWRVRGHMVLAIALAWELPILFLWLGNRQFAWHMGWAR